MGFHSLTWLRKWYNYEYFPALKTALEDGKLTKYQFDKLNRPVEKYYFDYKIKSIILEEQGLNENRPEP